jgi:hypothetical protein
MPDTKYFEWPYPNETEDPYYEKITDFFTRIDDQAFGMMNTAGNIIIPPTTIGWNALSNTLTWDTFFEVPLMSIGFTVKAEFAPDGISKSLVVPDGYRVTLVIPNTASGNTSVLIGLVNGAVSIQHGLITLGFARGNKFYANLPQVFT